MTKKKTIIILLIALAIYTIGIVPKEFQNDTFFYISIGKYISQNGIDMIEHFSWVPNLTYTYSHWIFDIIVYLAYSFVGFTGLYVSTIILSIFINSTLFILLTKQNKNPIIPFILVSIFAMLCNNAYALRSQLISFLCFILEIYVIEQYIETNKIKYCFILVGLSIIVANFHAATWPLFLILLLPYIVSAIIAKFAKIDSSKIYNFSKYNLKHLIILFIILCFTGLLTPIKDVPYTYILKSMFGKTNIENISSMSYITEMAPLTPITSPSFLLFMTLFIIFFGLLPTKIRLDRAFLISGLSLMALSSSRYIYLLSFLGLYVLCDLITQYVLQSYSSKWEKNLSDFDKLLLKVGAYSAAILFAVVFTKEIINYSFNETTYINPKLYPVSAVEFIKENIEDYSNPEKFRIYNNYNFGSYLMLNDIPPFIDSRLDVYCSEFNNTNVFRDFIYLYHGQKSYYDVFLDYDFTHILLYKTETVYQYMKFDSDYTLLYEDDNFALFEKTT